jgi:hypothetical protein
LRLDEEGEDGNEEDKESCWKYLRLRNDLEIFEVLRKLKMFEELLGRSFYRCR